MIPPKSSALLIDIALTVSPIRDSAGRITSASSIARDIGGRKRAEEQILALNKQLEKTADAAHTGGAIRAWEEWKPKLILMDVHMPVMDGLEATRKIKADPRGKETVIVALTASALDSDRRSVALAGADDFLSKPCREDELLEKLRGHLKIEYNYDELIGTASRLLATEDALGSERFDLLPAALIEEFREATLDGDKKRLDQLICRVEEAGDGEFSRALKDLADKYEYETLTRLLEKAGSG